MSPSWSHPRLRKQWPDLASGKSRSALTVHGVLLGSLDCPNLLTSVWQNCKQINLQNKYNRRPIAHQQQKHTHRSVKTASEDQPPKWVIVITWGKKVLR